MSQITSETLSMRMILTLLQSEYPNSFANMDERTMALKVELWESEFREDDIRMVYAAIRLYMKSPERFAPSIGQIRENMRLLLKDEQSEFTDQDAWALVSKACANGLHHSKEEFEKLPPEVQRTVGGHEQLKAWARMDAETVESVVASNFKRTFRTMQERKKQDALIPDGMREMISGIAQQMGITSAEKKQLEAPKGPKYVPAKLEQMLRNVAQPVEEKPKPEAAPEYTPPDPAEWERKREEMMKRLIDRQKGNDSNDSRALQGNSPDLGEQHAPGTAKADAEHISV